MVEWRFMFLVSSYDIHILAYIRKGEFSSRTYIVDGLELEKSSGREVVNIRLVC